jgi:hypothetical protein
LLLLRLDAIHLHQFLGVGLILGHAGRCDGFAFLNLRRDYLIQSKALGEQIFFGAESEAVRTVVSGAEHRHCVRMR